MYRDVIKQTTNVVNDSSKILGHNEFFNIV